MGRIVTLHAHRFEGAARLWALWQMGEARLPLMRMPGLEFWKLCGSGSGAGFRPAPDASVAVILASWGSEAAAEAGLARAPWTRWAARASERCALLLRPASSRGTWSGRAPFDARPAPVRTAPRPAGPEASSRGRIDPSPGREGAEPGHAPAPPGGGAAQSRRSEIGEEASAAPVASLTRASIRLAGAGGFWRRVPRLDDLIGANEEVLFRIGIGELPLIRQGTFTVWPSEAAMARYARTGPHAEAIAAIRSGRVFSEDLYARFDVPAAEGTWRGRPPLGAPAPTLADALSAPAPAAA